MKTSATKGLCQSCGKTLRRTAEHGTDLGGGRDPDYCRECFHEGLFVEPHLPMSECIERYDRASHASPGPRGRSLIPLLKRWRNTTP